MKKRYFVLLIISVILCNLIVSPINAEEPRAFPELMKYYSTDIVYEYADVFGYTPISTLSNDEYLYDIVYYDGYYMVLPYIVEWGSTPNGSSLPLYYHLEDIPEEWKRGMEDDQERDYGLRPDSEATKKYNCHSFAWYDQSPNNGYWLDNSSAYYDDADKSYVEITSGIRAGDIICYFNYYGRNIHSGIVTDVANNSLNNDCDNLELIGVQSKWGITGLYTHRGDNCPYTDKNPAYDMLEEEYRKELLTYSIKFYRPRTNMEIDLNANMSLRNSSISLSNTGEITDRYYMY